MAEKKQARGKKRRTPSTENTKKLADPFSAGVSRTWAFLDDLSASRMTFWICAFLLPAAVIACYPSSEALRGDYDVWFHLAYGKHYIQNLTWHIDHSIYSWTPARADAMYVTWLGSSIIYLVHAVLGVPGLFVLRMVLLLASGAVVFRLLKTADIRAGVSLLAGLLLVAVTIRIGAHYVKPEMFSIFLTTLVIAFYLRFRMSPGPWIMAVLPALFLFWVNMHGLWIFGLGFIGLALAADLVLFLVRRDHAIDRKALIYLSISAGLTLIALCLNPIGPAYPVNTALDLINPLSSALLSSRDAGDLGYFRSVAAYQGMWEHLLFVGKRDVFYTVSAWCMVLMIISLLPAWVVSWRRSGRADLPVVAANIVFFLMGMFMARLLVIFPQLWILSLVFFAWRMKTGPGPSRINSLFLAAFLALTGYVGFLATCVYAAPSWFGARYRDFVPVSEVRYIMDNNLPGPLFNDYLSGGYLMWAMFPEYKVFIDPRQFPHLDRVFPDYAGIGTKFPLDEKGLQSFMEKYPARIALIHYAYPNLILWFHKSPDWTLAYFDKAAVVMIRRDVAPILSPEARAAMRSPEKYKDVDNPIVLSYLFNVYNSFLGTRYAEQILGIYEQNVSDLFWFKKSELAGMRKILERSRKRE